MILAQNCPKTVKSSWHCPFKLCYIIKFWAGLQMTIQHVFLRSHTSFYTLHVYCMMGTGIMIVTKLTFKPWVKHCVLLLISLDWKDSRGHVRCTRWNVQTVGQWDDENGQWWNRLCQWNSKLSINQTQQRRVRNVLYYGMQTHSHKVMQQIHLYACCLCGCYCILLTKFA